jgi:hypothetical protein
MKTIGLFTTITAIAAAVGGVAVVLSSRKDIARYLKIRKM